MTEPISFVPHHALVTAEGATPERWLFVLHGVFGSGANFRLFARRLVEACPYWGACLVDLRGHGASQGAPPPHRLAAVADDVLRLERQLALPIGGIAGHSFGGKVALTYLSRRSARVDIAFDLDSPPGPGKRTGSAAAVLELLRSIPQPVPSREAFVSQVMAGGQPREIADWLAMNVRRGDDGLRILLDLPAIAEMLDDYYEKDLWRIVEGRVGTDSLQMIVGRGSSVVEAEERRRLAELDRAGVIQFHVIERAGHWLHVDAPDALFSVMSGALDAATPAAARRR